MSMSELLSRSVDVDFVISLGPCWLENREGESSHSMLLAIAGTSESWTLADVLALRGQHGISDQDWLWLVLAILRRWGAAASETRLFAVDCAERALRRERASGRELHEESIAAPKVAWRHGHGEATEEELGAAWLSAVSAIDPTGGEGWSAARSAACCAAPAGSDTSAWSAAWSDVENAVENSGEDSCAGRVAVRLAEAAWQCDRILELLK